MGDTRFRLVLQRALQQRLIGAEYLDRLIAQVPEAIPMRPILPMRAIIATIAAPTASGS